MLCGAGRHAAGGGRARSCSKALESAYLIRDALTWCTAYVTDSGSISAAFIAQRGELLLILSSVVAI